MSQPLKKRCSSKDKEKKGEFTPIPVDLRKRILSKFFEFPIFYGEIQQAKKKEKFEPNWKRYYGVFKQGGDRYVNQLYKSFVVKKRIDSNKTDEGPHKKSQPKPASEMMKKNEEMKKTLKEGLPAVIPKKLYSFRFERSFQSIPPLLMKQNKSTLRVLYGMDIRTPKVWTQLEPMKKLKRFVCKPPLGMLDETAIETFNSMKKLKVLLVHFSVSTARGQLNIQNLKRLLLICPSCFAPPFTRMPVSVDLSGLKNLKKLILVGCSLDNKFLTNLLRLPNLQGVSLFSCNVGTKYVDVLTSPKMKTFLMVKVKCDMSMLKNVTLPRHHPLEEFFLEGAKKKDLLTLISKFIKSLLVKPRFSHLSMRDCDLNDTFLDFLDRFQKKGENDVSVDCSLNSDIDLEKANAFDTGRIEVWKMKTGTQVLFKHGRPIPNPTNVLINPLPKPF